MITITIELPEEENSFFKEFLSKINGKIISETKIPNKETIKAMKELKEGKGIRAKSVEDFLKLV